MTEWANPESEPLFFDAVLHPHRSLPPKGFLILMAALCVVSFGAGLVFLLNGAWPVFGFFGLDVALIYLAFRLNYRSGRMVEFVRLTPSALAVKRISHRGEEFNWEFKPYWVKVELDEAPDETNRLYLTSHGRSLMLGGYLSSAERRELAAALRAALARARAPDAYLAQL